MSRILLGGTLVCVLFLAGAARAADNKDLKAAVQLVDPKNGKIVVSQELPGGGRKIVEYSVPKDAKITNAEGKDVKGGLDADVFKGKNNRTNVGVTIEFDNVNGKQVIKGIKITDKDKQ